MNAWTLTVVGLLPPLAVAALCACRGTVALRLAALQLTTAVAGPMLVAMTFAFDQPNLIDVALALAILSLPGTLLLALFVERWL